MTLMMASQVQAQQTQAQQTQAQADCEAQARTPLERIYCQVRAAGATSLPNMEEFRRNTERTQRLLLRRPAEQAGIALPPAAAPQSAPPRFPDILPEPAQPPTPPVPARPTPAPAAPSPVREAASPVVAEPPSSSGNLAGCELLPRRIRCADEHYALLGNRANSQLVAGILETAVLRLPAFTGDPRDEVALEDYLAEGYRRYIRAMVIIGLAANTMSYTRFYHTYQEVAATGADFAERMATMFEYLKRDKASMGVREHYHEDLPERIDQCMVLSAVLVVCDDVQRNWVYQRQ